MQVLDVGRPSYRFILLFFSCFMTLGPYYCVDVPSVLQTQIQGNNHCNNSRINETCCSDCLGLSGNQYNLLYTAYSWTNAIVVLGAGYLVDKCGNAVGLLVFSAMCAVGVSITSLGTQYPGTNVLLPLMILGRVLIGGGSGSLKMVQNRVIAFWFTNKELALAYAIVLGASRMGSVFNFFGTAHIYTAVGLSWTFWIGAFSCILAFGFAIVVSYLDVSGIKKLGLTKDISISSQKMKLSDVKEFPAMYWILLFTIMFFYNSVFPFVADASKFIQDKYDFSTDDSSYMTGAVYDLSIVITPIIGGLMDAVGKRDVLALLCAVLLIPVFILLAFTEVHPLVPTFLCGIAYSIGCAVYWPCIPLIVSPAVMGTAMGIAISLNMTGAGISSLVVGLILGKDHSSPVNETLQRWKYVMIFFLANALACTVATVALYFADKKQGGILNSACKKKTALSEELQADMVAETEPLLSKPVINS